MIIESAYEKQEEIPEAFRPLFTERNGKFELTGVKGVKPELAYTASQEALRKERADHGKAKDELKAWTSLGLSVEDLHAKLDLIPQLELAAGGKIKEMTEVQKTALTAPLQREIDKLRKDDQAKTDRINALESKDRTRTVHDAVRAAATEAKMLPGALEDALMLAERVFEVTEDGKVVVKDQVGYTPGLDPKTWLQDIQPKRAHWWPPSNGGGANGSGGGGAFTKNPWSKDHWNMTEQGRVVSSQGLEKATEMAKQAGSSIGAVAPTVK